MAAKKSPKEEVVEPDAPEVVEPDAPEVVEPDDGFDVYVREDGSEIKLNRLPATQAKAESLGWKKKGK